MSTSLEVKQSQLSPEELQCKRVKRLIRNGTYPRYTFARGSNGSSLERYSDKWKTKKGWFMSWLLKSKAKMTDEQGPRAISRLTWRLENTFLKLTRE